MMIPQKRRSQRKGRQDAANRESDSQVVRHEQFVHVKPIDSGDIPLSGIVPTHRLRRSVVLLSMAGTITAASVSPCAAQVILNPGSGAGAQAASGNGGSGGSNNGGGAGGSVGASAGQVGTLAQGGNGAGATSCDTKPYLAGCGGKTGLTNTPISGNAQGGDAVAGATGIGGGGGGAGAVITSGDLALAPARNAWVQGGRGGAAGTSAGAGGGGAGLVFMGGTLLVSGNDLIGGAGGDGTSTSAGGGGGVGLFFQGKAFTFNWQGDVHRILGGYGGASGGSAGAAVVVATDGASVTNISNRFGTGFQGGYGAAGVGSIPDGSGGDAMDIFGSNNTFMNRGYVNPGGSAGHAALAIGLRVQGDNNTIINANGGSLEGGWSLLNPTQTAPGGVAVELTGNGNILELQAGYAMGGKAIAAGGGNILALGGSSDGTFDVSKIVAALDNTTGLEQYQGFAEYQKTGLGTWTVTGRMGDSHPWAIEQSTLKLGADADLSAASDISVDATFDVSGVTANSTTIQSLSGASTGTVVLGNKTLVIANGQGGSTPFSPGNFAGAITGTGSVEIDGGKQTFSGTNTYQGGTLLNGGTLAVSANANLGTGGLSFNGGTLENTAAISSSRAVTLNANGGTFQTDNALTLSGAISGAGGLTKTGASTLTLTGAGTYTGPTTLSNGTLVIGNGFDSTFTSAITNNSALQFNDGEAFSYGGVLSGTGSLTQNGAGVVTLSGNSNAFAGATTVNAGTLAINGTLGGTVTVNSGTVEGTGTIKGDATIGAGTLAGRQGDVLNVGGNLALSSRSNVNVSLGAPSTATGLFNVAGNLTLAGTLNVTDLGGLGPGVYRVFDYAGTLTNNGLLIGSTPSGTNATDFSVQTATSHQVNLVDTGGATVNFWDGGTVSNHNNGAIDGGNGIWNATNDNWTTSSGSVNANWQNGQFAIFSGQAGTVTVDDTAGAISVLGMQFATDAYAVNGDAISLGNAKTIFRVGTGGGALSTGITATIASALTGTGGLEKTDSGTLVLSGSNTYTGGTFVNGGTLSVSSDANLGAAAGALTVDGGTFENTAAFGSGRTVTLGTGGSTFKTDADLALTGVVNGAGALLKSGSGTLTLTANNAYTGGTQISAGTLQLGNGGTSGSISGTIDDDAMLVINRSDAWTLNSAIGGSGSVTQAGTGTTALTGDSSYLGGTTITAGTLQLGNGGTSGSISGDVINNATLAFDRADTVIFDGKISGNGSITQIGAGMTQLTGDSSNFAGTTTVSNGTLSVDGVLGGVVSAQAGGTIEGTGTIKGDATIGAGTLAGRQGNVLNFSSNLKLSNASNVNVSLGAPDTSTGMFNVAGNLTLAGTLNISDLGGLGPGLYRLFDYAAGLSDNGLHIGSIPSGDRASDFSVQTSFTHEVNLVNTGGASVNFWDGGTASNHNNGTVDGGDGIWNTANNNWTTANGAANSNWQNGQFAIFAGQPGTVTVDDSAGAVSVSGMQFATDGYLVNGDAITLADAKSIIRVGAGGGALTSGITATIASALTGGGGLEKTDNGTLVLSGTNSYTGGTFIEGGALSVASDSNLGATSGGLTLDGGTLDNTSGFSSARGVTLGAGGGTFKTDADLALTSAISGSGGLFKSGAGTLTLDADNTYSGATTVAAGTLSVSGSVSGPVSVQAGGTLTGTGSVGTTDIASGGTIAPGHTPGTLHINGDVTFEAGSIYAAGILPDQTGDLIHATGQALIQGGTVQTIKAGGVYAPGSQWTIVSANGGVTGTFDALTQNMPFVDLSLAYDANHVYLDTRRNQKSFCSVAQTRNECATGQGVESLGQGNTIYNAVASVPDAASGRQALDALSGDVYASQKGAMITDSRVFRDAAIARLQQAFADDIAPTQALVASTDNDFLPPTPGARRVALWAQAMGGWNQWNGDGNAATFDRTLSGLAIGGDVPVLQNWRVGLMAGATNSRYDVSAREASGAIVDAHLSLYGGSQWGPLGVRFGVGYTWHDIDTHRTVAFPGFSADLSSHYGAAMVQGFGEVGYRLDSPLVTVEPFVNVATINLHTGGFTETGGAAALTTPASTTNVTFTTVGMRARKAYALYGWKGAVHGTVGWRHAVGELTPLSTFSFDGGSAFTIAGVPIARDAATIDAGLDLALSRAVTLGVGYSGQYAHHLSDYGVQAKLTVAF